ncbi:hypothetical protein [Pseudoalteromonas sp. S16_S37]|nr:hypothetical protein [Pseudoalteromonas sp. S16_S37]
MLKGACCGFNHVGWRPLAYSACDYITVGRISGKATPFEKMMN